MTGMGEALNDSLKVIRAGAGNIIAETVSHATDNTMRIRRPDVSVYRNNTFTETNPENEKNESQHKMLWFFGIGCMVIGLIIIAAVTFSSGKEKPKPAPPPKTPTAPAVTKPIPPSTMEKTPVRQPTAVPQSTEKAEQLYKDALAILNGKKGQRDINEAINLLRTAVANDYAPAINRLGEMFFYEEYGMNDHQKAIELFRQAAGMNNAMALYNLGECFYYGKCGVARDYQQAVTFYLKAQNLGCREAIFALGRCYDRGHGVPQNKSQAMLLYRQAAAQNYGPAKAMLSQDKIPGQS